MSSERSVTVIIATRGWDARAELLREAIDSVVAQEDVRALPLVVLNGDDRSAEIERSLRADSRVRLLIREEARIGSALRAGREAVETPWFGTLDDDDLLLPGALATRLRELERHPECSTVVTNGYLRSAGVRDELNITSGVDINTDPLRALLRRNWLLPGSWLCRTDVVGPTLFAGMPSHFECTFLAARFATEYVMRWLDVPTVVYRLGSPHAVSRSREFLNGEMEALKRILQFSLPEDVRQALRRRITASFHYAADRDLRAGALGEAWRQHLASLRHTGGWRHLGFTRHLVRAAIERMVGS